MIIREHILLRKICGQTVGIPCGSTALTMQGMFALSETGALLFEALQTEQTRDSLVELLLSEYEIDRDTARADVGAFLRQMADLGLLREDELEED